MRPHEDIGPRGWISGLFARTPAVVPLKRGDFGGESLVEPSGMFGDARSNGAALSRYNYGFLQIANNACERAPVAVGRPGRGE